MRLFTAIDLPPEVTEKLAALLARLRPTARLKWSSVDNLHITTKFIGEWPRERLGELLSALGGLPDRPSIPIGVRGLGWFPNPRAPRVFWAGVEAGPALAELARDTDRALAALGITPESRPFSPHLTLARIKERTPLDGVRQTLAALPGEEFGEFTADRFNLYQSELHPSGSVYTRIEELVFGGS